MCIFLFYETRLLDGKMQVPCEQAALRGSRVERISGGLGCPTMQVKEAT